MNPTMLSLFICQTLKIHTILEITLLYKHMHKECENSTSIIQDYKIILITTSSSQYGMRTKVSDNLFLSHDQ